MNTAILLQRGIDNRAFFSAIGIALATLASVMMIPVLSDYFATGLVPRYPTLICACFLLSASLLSFSIALILDAVKEQSDRAFELTLANVALLQS